MLLWGLAFAGSALPTLAVAQSTQGAFERYGGVADHVNIRGGVLFSGHGTLARVDSEALGLGTLVSFEDDLGLATTTRDARVDGYIRLGRRHQLRAGYIHLGRGGDVQLQREIQWGDEIFDVSAGVTSALDLTMIPINYRFALVKSDRVDFGLSAGVFAMFAEASVAAPSIAIDESEALSFPLPVFGADVEIALAPRLFLLGGGEYFGIAIQDVSGSWREFRAALEYYPVPHLGIGTAYRYVRLEIDGTGALGQSLSGTEIFFDYRLSGPQAYIALAF